MKSVINLSKKTKYEIINNLDIEEFKKYLRNYNSIENRERLNYYFSICLINKFYLECKKCYDLFYLWFRDSVRRVILTPGFLSSKLAYDEYYLHEIFHYFLIHLQPHYQGYDPNKSTPLVFLTQLLKMGILNFLRKYYKRDKNEISFSDLIEIKLNKLHDFDVDENLVRNDNNDLLKDYLITRETAELVWNSFKQFFEKLNVKFPDNITFIDFYYDFNDFVNNYKGKLDLEIIYNFFLDLIDNSDLKRKKYFEQFRKFINQRKKSNNR